MNLSVAPRHPLVQPFSIEIPEASLRDLRERLRRTRWPDEVPDSGWDFGTNLGYLKNLVAYWQPRANLGVEGGADPPVGEEKDGGSFITGPMDELTPLATHPATGSTTDPIASCAWFMFCSCSTGLDGRTLQSAIRDCRASHASSESDVVPSALGTRLGGSDGQPDGAAAGTSARNRPSRPG